LEYFPVTLIPLSISLKLVIFNLASLNQVFTSFGVCLNANFGECQLKFTPTSFYILNKQSVERITKTLPYEKINGKIIIHAIIILLFIKMIILT